MTRSRPHVSPGCGSCLSRSFSIFSALRVSRFYRIFFVGGRLTYMRTTAHPPPRTSGKLDRRWIRVFFEILNSSGSRAILKGIGPRRWANHELLEAGRPSFYDLANPSIRGSKGPYQRVREGFAKVSFQANEQVGSLRNFFSASRKRFCPHRGRLEFSPVGPKGKSALALCSLRL